MADRVSDDRLTTVLKAVAIGMVVAFLGWAIYDKLFVVSAPGDLAYHDANNLFEDGFYDRAADGYREALAEAPDHLYALRGLARSLHKLGERDQALAIYDQAIAQEPGFAGTYANRGILLDTMGRHEEALADYMVALDLDPTIADGPHWLTRFLRKQPDAPPIIADRARYLQAELAKPEAERVLLQPEIDQQQRPYRQ
jgi:tetratricopeptide (TPR) repeat protein